MKNYKFQVGDRVQYNQKWLQSVGLVTGNIPKMQGIVSSIQTTNNKRLLRIKWDSGEEYSGLSTCFCRVGLDPTI